MVERIPRVNMLAEALKCPNYIIWYKGRLTLKRAPSAKGPFSGQAAPPVQNPWHRPCARISSISSQAQFTATQQLVTSGDLNLFMGHWPKLTIALGRMN